MGLYLPEDEISEIESLISISDDDLKASKSLLEIGQYRNSIVLSYYSMYSIARALLLKKGVEPSSHSGLIRALGEFYVVPEGFDKVLARRFSRSRTKREKASYPTFDTTTKKDAEENIKLAEEFKKEAKKFIK